MISDRDDQVPNVTKTASLQCLYSISKKEVRDEADFFFNLFTMSQKRS